MTTFYAKRVGNSLVPDGDESIVEFAKVPFDKTIRVEAKQPRNITHHRLYFALCARIAAGIGSDTEMVSDMFKIATGHCWRGKSKKYGWFQVPRSIAFHNMDQTEFSEFFERCCRTAYSEWGIEPESINDLLLNREQAA